MAKRIRRPDEVYDEQGRQRFHGAFTGGFSAGYFNTVGSREGWKPRAANDRTKQSIEDFMDDEDVLDTRIHASFQPKQRMEGDQADNKLVELIRVDDLIGQKLLAKLGRRQVVKSTIVLPKASNLSRRGLNFEPDKRLQSAKKASLQQFYRPDDEYEVYDATATSSDYHTEIMDYEDEHDDDHDPSSSSSSFLSKLDQYANLHSNTSTTTTSHHDHGALPGFRMDSAESSSSSIKRFPGPDVPMTFIVSDRTFPIPLSDAEVQLRDSQPQNLNLGSNISAPPSSTKPEVTSSTAVNFEAAQFHKVAEEMRKRFTSASTTSTAKQQQKQHEEIKKGPKRVVTVFQPCKLLCKRFEVPFVNRTQTNTATTTGANKSALDQVLTSAQNQQQHQQSANAKDDQVVGEEEAIRRPAMDLFKSIFEDSSSDEDEDEEDEEKDSQIDSRAEVETQPNQPIHATTIPEQSYGDDQMSAAMQRLDNDELCSDRAHTDKKEIGEQQALSKSERRRKRSHKRDRRSRKHDKEHRRHYYNDDSSVDDVDVDVDVDDDDSRRRSKKKKRHKEHKKHSRKHKKKSSSRRKYSSGSD